MKLKRCVVPNKKFGSDIKQNEAFAVAKASKLFYYLLNR